MKNLKDNTEKCLSDFFWNHWDDWDENVKKHYKSSMHIWLDFNINKINDIWSSIKFSYREH